MMDFCEIVRNIEKNPHDLVPIKTVRDLLLLKAHVSICETCAASVERVSKRPDYPSDGIEIGLN